MGGIFVLPVQRYGDFRTWEKILQDFFRSIYDSPRHLRQNTGKPLFCVANVPLCDVAILCHTGAQSLV